MALSPELVKSLKPDFVQLQLLSLDQIRKLSSVAAKFILNPKSYDFETELSSFSELNQDIQPAQLKAAVRGLLTFYHEVNSLQISGITALPSEIFDDLNITIDASKVLSSSLQQEKLTLNTSAIEVALASNLLVDLDWNFGVTASSDECVNVGKIFIQLKLTVSRQGHLENEFVELTVDQFYALLGKLEQCKSYIDSITSS